MQDKYTNSISNNKGKDTTNCARVACKSCGDNSIKNIQNTNTEKLELKNDFTKDILSENSLENSNKKLNNTKENFKNAHITYNDCTTNATCAEKVGNIMQIEKNNQNKNAKSCVRVAIVSRTPVRGEKKVVKCGYKTSEVICVNDIKFNRDEQAEVKVQTGFTAKLCVCLFALVACVAFALGFCLASLSGSSVSNVSVLAESFGGGEGTESNPYLISSFANLNALASSCNSGTTYENNYFKLTANITIGGTDLSNWTPIGCDTTAANSDACYFAGIFDGDNHTITYQGSVSRSVGQSSTSGAKVYWGLLFGYVEGNGTTAVAATNGIVKNVNIALDDNNLSTTDEFEIALTPTSVSVYFGGVVGYSNAGIVDNCNLSGSALDFSSSGSISYGGGIVGYGFVVSNCEFNANCSAIGGTAGGVVAFAKISVSNCKFYGNFEMNANASYCGVICGQVSNASSTMQNCEVIGKVNIFRTQRIGDCQGIGGIAGHVFGSIANCHLKMEEGSAIEARGMSFSRCGLIAGVAYNGVSNCYVEGSMTSFESGASTIDAGLACGRNNGEMTNCVINVTIGTLSLGSAFNFVTHNENANNCIVIADIETLTASSGGYLIGSSTTAYNCVAITKVGGTGTTYPLSSSNAGTTASGVVHDKTNGLYSVAWSDSNSALINQLKQTSTYTNGTSNFIWNTAGGTSGGTAWSFATEYPSETGTWYIADNFNDGFPVLKQFYVPPIINITINVTTNLGSSTTGSGTTGSIGSASEGGTAGLVNKFILYKLDSAGNIVNQYVVGSGSTIQFESTIGEAFTLKLIHKLYMVTTIDGESVLQKTFTPSADKTIAINITAPANVNTWIII